ncbi:WxL domain-containing protein [Enterococcus sp. HY326]|uniref:WxL domain-containing protein n=1 Tax=Enterococcus sp. HY326 TaxID=2971265 RepID=UPI00223F6907|nr:WxL domain-containing protein [Enterococcus sp. HY326]
MKLRSLCATAMVAAIGATLLVPVGASAAGTTHSLDSTGRVIVSAGSLDPNLPIIDPEKPGEEIDPGGLVPGVDPGQLGIKNVSDLNFGEINTGRAQINKPAAAQTVNQLVANGTPVEVTRGAMVVFGDIRGTNAGYTVQAELTQQFTSYTTDGTGAEVLGTATLDGASISFSNGILETDFDNPATAGTMTNTAFELSIEDTVAGTGGAVEVVRAANGTGAGEYTLEFGQSASYSQTDANIAVGGVANTADKAVVLNVPIATASSMTAANYKALVTWTIASLA